MQINPRSHVPIYLQIAEGIREAVSAGIYRPGEPLPSLRALAMQIKVNPNTVQRAYEELSREGLIYTQRGKGLFVSNEAKTDARTQARRAVRRSFEEGIRAGSAAGMKAEEIQEAFEECLAARVSSEENES